MMIVSFVEHNLRMKVIDVLVIQLMLLSMMDCESFDKYYNFLDILIVIVIANKHKSSYSSTFIYLFVLRFFTALLCRVCTHIKWIILSMIASTEYRKTFVVFRRFNDRKQVQKL
jgi:hypothetical protein